MASQEELKSQIEEEISQAGDIYRSLDANEDESVTKKELKQGLETRKAAVSSSDVLTKFYTTLVSNFDEADKSDDDKLSFVEFILFFNSVKDAMLSE